MVIDNDSKNQNEFLSNIEKIDNPCKFHVIRNSSNKGLATAQNQGAQFVLDNGYEAFCIFDQDSHVEPDYLDIIVKDYNSLVLLNVSIGAIGPCVVDRSSGKSYPIAIYDGFLLNRYYLKDGEIAECSYIISSGSLIGADALKIVGFFLDRLFINYIDIEWCFRCAAHNLKVFTTNNAKITQDVGVYRKMFFGRAIPVHNPIRRYYAARNSVIMLFLPHVSIGYKFREAIFNPLRLIFDCVVEGNTLHRVNFFLKGVYDGIRGK